MSSAFMFVIELMEEEEVVVEESYFLFLFLEQRGNFC